MNFSTKTASKLVGVFFIVAAVTSIIGGLILYKPILNDPNYLTQGAAHASEVVWGALMELILVVCAIGTATTMFPFLKKYHGTLAVWHVCFRFLEAIIITVGVISVLSLLTVSKQFVAAGAQDIAAYQVAGTLLKAIHDWTFLLGPSFFLGINTLIYSYVFYKSGQVHRFIPILGMTGAVCIFLSALLVMFGVIDQVSAWGAVLALPVFANEMTLAVWLIVKGFREPAAAKAPVNRTHLV